MDTTHKTKSVCGAHGVCVRMGMEFTLLSGHGITAGRAGSSFTVQIKTAEITTTIENRFSPRCFNDTVNPKTTQTHSHTHAAKDATHLQTLMMY